MGLASDLWDMDSSGLMPLHTENNLSQGFAVGDSEILKFHCDSLKPRVHPFYK